jgi:type VI secretion system protein ImpH
MASRSLTAQIPLHEELIRHGSRYDVFQAIELLVGRSTSGAEPGTDHNVENEDLYFGVDSSLGFPLSDIVRIQSCHDPLDPERELLRMEVAFLGLHGAGSPLPSYFSEQIAQTDADESAAKAFNDFFHNRLVGLLYRVWRKNRFYLRYRPGARDGFSANIFSLMGLSGINERENLLLEKPVLLSLAGTVCSHDRSASALAGAIKRLFKLENVLIQQWVKRRVHISPEQQNRLGKPTGQLGRSFLIGDSSADIQGKFAIVLEDLSFESFRYFLPDGSGFRALQQLLNISSRKQLACDLILKLKPEERKPITLASSCSGRLGWSSFLGSSEHPQGGVVSLSLRN